jgi:hypothetical protein
MSASTKFIHPTALKALNTAFKKANLKPVIVQTQGDAPESAGTHGSAGHYIDAGGKRQSYSACIDISVNQAATRLSDKKKVVMDKARVRWLLYCLAKEGFAGFYRTEAQGFTSHHVHIICAMVPVDGLPESQVIDFLNDRNGLKGHGQETFWTADDDVDQYIATKFALANPEAAKRLPSKYRGVLA